MTLEGGTRLGPYEILSPLGAGGMGEVYRARDSKLGREVAIKVLPEELSNHPQKLARFEREARLLAALNHPGIATIYEVEAFEGKPFLVMELVEGETLAERIAHRPLPVKEALGVARQIADALDAAHEKGVIHRDLKPANIKVDPEGRVKVLDFGLAKAFAAEDTPESELSQSPTLSRDATRAGVILGTAAYMSPEQAKGKSVDKRTDIFSFGIVLFEMLAGKRPFGGDEVSDVLARILAGEPDWQALPENVPPSAVKLLERCLAKERKERLRDIADARLEIEDILAEPRTPVALESAKGGVRPMWRALAALLGVLLVAALAIWWMLWPSEPSVVRLTATLGSNGLQLPPHGAIQGSMVVLSPDGQTLAFLGRGNNGKDQLYLRSLDALEARPIDGTDDAFSPFFSPNGQWLAFFTLGALKRVSVSGGAPLTIADVPNGRGGAWGPDDTIVYAPNAAGGLYRVPASGGTPVELTTLEEGERSHRWPSFLPNGRAVLFASIETDRAVDDGTLEVVLLETGERKVVYRGGTDPSYASTGHLIYAHESTLFAIPFDSDQIEATAEPTPVIQGVLTGTTNNGASYYSTAENGSLVYAPPFGTGPRRFVWVDREGRETQMSPEPDNYAEFTLSPDGTKIAVRVSSDVWIYDLVSDTSTRLTFDPTRERSPVWSPDGRRVAFGGAGGMYWKAADGTGEVVPIGERPSERNNYEISALERQGLRPEAFSPDGTRLVYQDLTSNRDLAMVSLEGDDASTMLLDTEFEERNAVISPDGRYIAYESDESGQFEVYVRPFPNVGEQKWPVSSDGGMWALWAPSGRELFYLGPETMMAVAIETEPTVMLGRREPLFGVQPYAGLNSVSRRVAISRDGQQFLMLKGDETANRDTVVVVLNWFEELKRLVPAN